MTAKCQWEGGYPRSHVWRKRVGILGPMSDSGGGVSQVSCLGKGWISLGGDREIPYNHYLWCIGPHHTTTHGLPPPPPDMGPRCTGTDHPSPLPDMFKLVHYETHTFGKQEARILLECFLVRRLFALLFSRKEVRKTIEKENMVVLVIIHQRKGELLLKKIEKIFWKWWKKNQR